MRRGRAWEGEGRRRDGGEEEEGEGKGKGRKMEKGEGEGGKGREGRKSPPERSAPHSKTLDPPLVKYDGFEGRRPPEYIGLLVHTPQAILCVKTCHLSHQPSVSAYAFNPWTSARLKMKRKGRKRKDRIMH